jgi:hypothetical protein
MYEMDVVRHPMNPYPVDGPTLGKNGAELLYLGYVVAYGLVACHTQAHRRDGGGRALGNVSVAEGAI